MTRFLRGFAVGLAIYIPTFIVLLMLDATAWQACIAGVGAQVGVAAGRVYEFWENGRSTSYFSERR